MKKLTGPEMSREKGENNEFHPRFTTIFLSNSRESGECFRNLSDIFLPGWWLLFVNRVQKAVARSQLKSKQHKYHTKVAPLSLQFTVFDQS